MENINDVFSPEVKKALQGVYVHTYNSGGYDYGCVPVLPVKEALTPDNFFLIAGEFRYTVDDFRWYDEDGSDRDFQFDDSDNYLASSCVPDEVFVLLNTVICTKFATRHLDDARAMLDCIEDDEIREEIAKGITDFDKATDSKEKLKIAEETLYAAFDAFDGIDKDISDEFGNASEVVVDVLAELADRC